MKMKKIMKSLLFGISVLLISAANVNAQSVAEGLRHLNAERYIQAGQVFNDLVKADPSTENYFQLGRFLLSTPDAKTNIEKANEAFEKGNALEKKGDINNTIGLGLIKLAEEDFGGAKLIFDELIKKGRNKDADLLYRIAEAYTLLPWANDPAEAVMLIDNVLEIKKEDNPQYYVVKAKAYDIKNEGGDIMNALQNAERLGAKDMASIYSFMAKIWLQGKNYKEAGDAINKSIAADKEHAPAYYYLSSLHQTYQRWEEAAKAAEQYLRFGDGDCGAKLRYIKLAFTAKDFTNVLAKLKEIEACNQDPIVHRLSGISKFELGDNEGAIQDLKKYISLADKEEIFGLDYGFIGRAYLAMTDEEKMPVNDGLAIQNIDKAISLKDTTFPYYDELANYFQTKKDYNKAEDFTKKSITHKKNPNGEDWWKLGYLQYVNAKYASADSTFDKVIAAYKDTWAPPYLMSARSKAQKNVGDTTFAAHESYAKYISLIPEDQKAANAATLSEAYNYLAVREWLVNKDSVKAMVFIDELLKYDPTYQRAIDLKNAINGITKETETGDTPKKPSESGK